MKYIKQTLSQIYVKFIRLPLLVVIQDTSDTNNEDFEYNRILQIDMCPAETQTSWPAYLGNLRSACTSEQSDLDLHSPDYGYTEDAQQRLLPSSNDAYPLSIRCDFVRFAVLLMHFR